MRYCEKCGKEISENAKFCTHCGNPVKPVPVATESKTVNVPKEPVAPADSVATEKKKKVPFKTIAAILCVALAAVVVFWFLLPMIQGPEVESVDIDFSNCFELELAGSMEGEATGKIVVNYDLFDKAVWEKAKAKKNVSCKDLVSVEQIDKRTLSNGDLVQAIYTIDQKAFEKRYRIRLGDLDYQGGISETVHGLGRYLTKDDFVYISFISWRDVYKLMAGEFPDMPDSSVSRGVFSTFISTPGGEFVDFYILFPESADKVTIYKYHGLAVDEDYNLTYEKKSQSLMTKKEFQYDDALAYIHDVLFNESGNDETVTSVYQFETILSDADNQQFREWIRKIPKDGDAFLTELTESYWYNVAQTSFFFKFNDDGTFKTFYGYPYYDYTVSDTISSTTPGNITEAAYEGTYELNQKELVLNMTTPYWSGQVKLNRYDKTTDGNVSDAHSSVHNYIDKFAGSVYWYETGWVDTTKDTDYGLSESFPWYLMKVSLDQGNQTGNNDYSPEEDIYISALRSCLNNGTDWEMFGEKRNLDPYDSVDYSMFDIDGNGIKEMIIRVGNTYSDDYIEWMYEGVYTLTASGDIKEVLSHTIGRGNVIIYDNGWIQTIGSPGAVYMTNRLYSYLKDELILMSEYKTSDESYANHPSNPYESDNHHFLSEEEMNTRIGWSIGDGKVVELDWQPLK